MKHFLSIVVLSVIFTGLFWFFELRLRDDASLISPLPDFLTLEKNKQVTLLDLWLPFWTEAYGSENSMPEITADSVLVYDLSTEKVLFEKNPRIRRPMASLSKVMTAIIALEKGKEANYEVLGVDLVGENIMGLGTGEILSREELLYGLLLPSGNDAAEVLARNYIDGSREGFIKAMNDKALALGLKDTRFSNPSGLQGDGEQYTTAYDLLVITRYAIENFPLFEKIVSSPSYDVLATSGHKGYGLFNETNLLTTYPGVKGVKTGYTPEAGFCLVTYLDYGGHRIIGIILNSESRRKEMKELLDYSLSSLGIEPPEYTGG